MKDDEIFKEMEELLSKLDIKIRFGRGYFKGGLCRYKDEKYFYLNRTDDKEKHISDYGLGRIYCGLRITDYGLKIITMSQF